MKKFIAIVVGIVMLGGWTVYWYRSTAKEKAQTQIEQAQTQKVSEKPSLIEQFKINRTLKAQQYQKDIARLRFKKEGEFVYCYSSQKPIYATIVQDTKTGIKYITVWLGMGNGGPMMTRLWEK